MSEIVDLDALLAEGREWTEVKLRGEMWRFGTMEDVPLALYAMQPETLTDEMNLLADTLTAAVDPEQREAFAGLTLTMREAEALFNMLTQSQQGVEPGESSASPASSDTED